MSIRVTGHSIPLETRQTISDRYERIRRAVNLFFWNSDNSLAHSFYVGSYGRGTAIKTSDLDVLMELPYSEYEHFTSLNGNGQSRLLQAVKSAVLATYPTTNIKGDGQVVVVQFSDGIKFEVLPAFKDPYRMGGAYLYPDTHMGGNWLSTNPKAEIEAMREKDRESNHLLLETCQHIRFIRDYKFSSYHLSGILIDSFVYRAIGEWHYLREGEKHTDTGISYEEHLLSQYNNMCYNGIILPHITAPGSGMKVASSAGWDVLGKILRVMV